MSNHRGLQKSLSSKHSRYKVWINQAKFDLEAAQTVLSGGHYEWTCYMSTQAVEKILKGVIVHSGYRPPKIHKLGILVSMTNRANNLFESVKINFRKIEAYTFISRYPFIIPGDNKTPHESISKQDAETCLALATDILEKVSDFLAGIKSVSTENDIEMNDYYYSEDQVSNRINQVVDKIKDCKKIDVSRIILFGAFARDKTPPKTSTMDILVIAQTDLSFLDRIQYVRQITKGSEPIVEPIVYTPAEFSFMTGEEGEGFLESAIEEGREIWSKEKNYS